VHLPHRLYGVDAPAYLTMIWSKKREPYIENFKFSLHGFDVLRVSKAQLSVYPRSALNFNKNN